MNDTDKARLASWKEIAQHLHKDERTARRWAKLGMPLHREPGEKRGRIFAYVHEIDAWLAGAKPAEASPARAQAVIAAPRLRSLVRTPRLVQAGVITALAIGLYAIAAIAWRATASALPVSIALHDHKFVALDRDGRALWTYPVPDENSELQPDRTPGIAYVGDLVGDGHREALVSLPYPQRALGMVGERQLYCFSQLGKLLWRFDPQDTIRFGSGDYGPPWSIRHWLLYRSGNETRLAVVFTHHTWWPSVLIILDARGQEMGRFVSSGEILNLASMDAPSGSLLLIGGVSNSNDRNGFFAVLSGSHLSGSSPEQPGSGFECKSCLPGKASRYFIFPRSELNIVASVAQNWVTTVEPVNNRVEVRTEELELPTANAEGIFEFTRNLELNRAAWSDGYFVAHREFEREGKIHHSWEQCPDRFGPRVIRAWDPEHGWTEIHPQTMHK